MKKVLTIIICLLSTVSSFGQGTVRGKIIDEKGETVIGAAIVLKSDKSFGTVTDFDGNYSIKIKDSLPQTLVISLVSYTTIEFTVHPKNGEVIIRDFAMIPSSLEIKEVEISAKAVKSREYFVDKIKKNSATTIDYISSETMKKTGDANVAAAVARVSGVSTNGDFITVRGIGDRYVKTAINGSVIPTLDPFTNNIKLDLFPSSLVDNIIITKTASPDLPGDWAGAYLSVETKDYPEQLAINVETYFGYNAQSSFQNMISSQKSSTDWLGYDDGLRHHDHSVFTAANQSPTHYQEFVALGLGPYYNSLGVTQENWGEGTQVGETYYKLGLVQLGLLQPALINDPAAFSTAQNMYNNGQYKPDAFSVINKDVPATGKSFPVNWNTTEKQGSLNFSQSFSIGNQTNLFKKPLGYLFGFKYGSTSQYDPEGNENRIRDDGSLETSVMEQISKETNNWSALMNLSYKFSPNNSVSLIFMPNFNGMNKVRKGVDDRDYANHVWTNSQYYEERKQLVYQLKTEHYLTRQQMKIEVNACYTDGESSAPDFKNIQYWRDPISNSYQIGGSIGDGVHRYYRYLDDNLLDSRITAELPLGKDVSLNKKLKFGAAYQQNNRKSDQYDYMVYFGPNYTLNMHDDDLNKLFNENIFDIHSVTDPYGHSINAIDAYYINNESPANHTFGNSKIMAAFAMVDLSLSSRIRFSGGLRVEKSDILTDVTEFDSLGYPANDSRRTSSDGFPLINPGEINETSFLPSANVIYKIRTNEDTPFNLRVNYSQTVARPAIRELSDVATLDYDLRSFVFGNSDLKMVKIHNYDVRFENYYNLKGNAAVSFFFKDFRNHIELVRSAGYTWQNVDRSEVAGIELEWKQKFAKHFEFSSNVTLAYSHTKYVRQRMEIDGGGYKTNIPQDTVERQMYGQSPYVINGMLSYSTDSSGLTISLTYNLQGPRMVIASDKPEVSDIYELPRHLFDAKVVKTLGKHFGVSVSVKDIIGTTTRRAYKTDTGWGTDYDRFKYGTVYILGVTYKL